MKTLIVFFMLSLNIFADDYEGFTGSTISVGNTDFHSGSSYSSKGYRNYNATTINMPHASHTQGYSYGNTRSNTVPVFQSFSNSNMNSGSGSSGPVIGSGDTTL